MKFNKKYPKNVQNVTICRLFDFINRFETIRQLESKVIQENPNFQVFLKFHQNVNCEPKTEPSRG